MPARSATQMGIAQVPWQGVEDVSLQGTPYQCELAAGTWGNGGFREHSATVVLIAAPGDGKSHLRHRH